MVPQMMTIPRQYLIEKKQMILGGEEHEKEIDWPAFAFGYGSKR